MQDGLDTLRGSVRNNNDEFSAILSTVTKRLDDSEFKMSAMVKGIENLQVDIKSKENKLTKLMQNFKAKQAALAITDRPSEQEYKIGALESELRLVKEGLAQERQRRDALFGDILAQYKEINGHVSHTENDLLIRMRKHKEEVIEEGKRTKDQQRKLEE